MIPKLNFDCRTTNLKFSKQQLCWKLLRSQMNTRLNVSVKLFYEAIASWNQVESRTDQSLQWMGNTKCKLRFSVWYVATAIQIQTFTNSDIWIVTTPKPPAFLNIVFDVKFDIAFGFWFGVGSPYWIRVKLHLEFDADFNHNFEVKLNSKVEAGISIRKSIQPDVEVNDLFFTSTLGLTSNST